MSWYLGVWKKYAVFTGRARRKEYWFFYLFNMIAVFCLSFADIALGLAGDSGNGPLLGLYYLAALLPMIAVGVRRMHDSDHSGWWLIVPLVNLIFLLTDGTHGPNRFGPDPKSALAGYARPHMPAGWLPDPTGRHQFRYWDSAQWTHHVSDAGAVAQDPL